MCCFMCCIIACGEMLGGLPALKSFFRLPDCRTRLVVINPLVYMQAGGVVLRFVGFCKLGEIYNIFAGMTIALRMDGGIIRAYIKTECVR